MPESEPVPHLQDLLGPENVLLGLESEDRASVVKVLFKNLAETKRVSAGKVPSFAKLVGEREDMGSTALGGGLAVPHARCGLERPILAMAILKGSMEGWNPLDGMPVRVVFLLLTPRTDDACHRSLLKTIAGFSKIPPRMRALSGSQTPEDVLQVLREFA